MCNSIGVSGRGFLGLSQKGISAHGISEPSAVSSMDEDVLEGRCSYLRLKVSTLMREVFSNNADVIRRDQS